MRKITFTPNEYYHIYNHSVEDRKIFLTDIDYERFLVSLAIFNDKGSCSQNPSRFIRNPALLTKHFSPDNRDRLVDIIVFTLLPNHYHLLVQERKDQGISRFMHRLSKGYSRYFNLKYKRIGTLWQGNFGAKHIDKEAYLVHIISYIHLNILDLFFPKWREGQIKEWGEAEKKMRKYLWSSYEYYRTNKSKIPFINLITTKPDWFSEHFPAPKAFEENLKLWSLRNNP